MSERIREKVIVPVKGSEVSLNAVKLADEIFAEEDVIPVHVILVKAKLPVDAELAQEADHGESMLEKAEGILARGHHKGAKGELLQARDLGNALIDEGVERGAGRIVMGFNLKNSRDAMSNATRRVLTSFKGEVVLYRPAKATEIDTGAPRPNVIRLERQSNSKPNRSFMDRLKNR